MECFQGSGSVQKSLHYLKMEISHKKQRLVIEPR